MGRRTWDSIGRALPNRLNVVITRQKNFVADGAIVIHSLDELQTIETNGVLFIVGGGELYTNALDAVDKLHITRIHTTIDGDTFFPQIDGTLWSCEESISHSKDDKNLFDLTFETWSRVK